MNNYLLTLVLKSDLDDKAREGVLADVKKRVESDGKVEKTDLWGQKDLAYPIKHNQKGYYAHFEFSANPSLISSIDKALKLEEDIIRYLLVRV